MSERKHYQLDAMPGAVDSEAGTMRDVTIIAFGEAKGHDAFIDDRTLEGAIKLLMGKSLKAYVTHDNAYGDRTLGEIGLFGGFYLQDGKIKAATFQAFDSFKKDEPEKYNRLFELAQMAPEEFGISIVFTGSLAWPLRSGDDMEFEDDTPPDGAVREIPSIRVSSIESADFVAKPAATPSLFNQDGEQLDESSIGNMDEEKTLETEETEEAATEEVVAEVTEDEPTEAEETEEAAEETEEVAEESEESDDALAIIERLEILEVELQDSRDTVAKLEKLLDGQPALDAQPEETEAKSIREQYLSLTGAARHTFWVAHKNEILMGK